MEVRTKRNIMLMLKLAKEEASKLNTAFTLVSLIGPITISLLSVSKRAQKKFLEKM